MSYSDQFGSRLAVSDGQGDRRMALDAIGMALAKGYITWDSACYFAQLANNGQAAELLSHMNPLFQDLLLVAA